jgi:hypothetical protein
MISIQFRPDSDWWVSGKVLDRLFEAALHSGIMPPRLAKWHEVADANGGLDLSLIDPSDAKDLANALKLTAEGELSRLRDAEPASDDGSYRASLTKLLEVA